MESVHQIEGGSNDNYTKFSPLSLVKTNETKESHNREHKKH